MLDIFRTSQPFPDDVDIRITLHRSPAPFSINAKLEGDTAGYEITIKVADLCFTRMRTAENVYDRIGSTIDYPFTCRFSILSTEKPYIIRNTLFVSFCNLAGFDFFGLGYETRHFVVPSESMTLSLEIFNQAMPKRMIASFISQEAFVGKYEENPFFFDHHLLQTLFLRKNQITSIPPHMFKTELVKKDIPAQTAIAAVRDAAGNVVKEAQAATAAETKYSITQTGRLYVESMRVLNDKSLNNVNIGITKEDFESGMFFMCTDFRVSPRPR